jgi:hypothetical protein
VVRQRVAVAVAVAGLIGSGAPAHAAVEHPRAGCARRVTDALGDGTYKIGSGSTSVDRPNAGSTDALDVSSLTLRYTSTALEAHLQLKSLVTQFAAYETAYRYEITFTNAEGTKYTLHDMVLNPQYDTPATKAPQTGVRMPGGTYTRSGNTYNIDGVTHEPPDTANGWIVVRIPASEFAKGFTDPPAPGAVLSKITASSYAYVVGLQNSQVNGTLADTTADAVADPDWALGDDYCFGPPPATLGDFAAPAVQYSDTTTLRVTLTSDAGAKLAGKTVEFTVAGEPGMPLRGVTDAAGVAAVKYTPKNAAGTYAVTVRYPGDATDGAATLTSGRVVVAAEGVVAGPLRVTRPTGTTRVITVTVTDDDAHPVGKKTVDWYVNGKKVASTTTDARGVTAFKGAKPGQTVSAVSTAVAGRYLQATAKPVKV